MSLSSFLISFLGVNSSPVRICLIGDLKDDIRLNEAAQVSFDDYFFFIIYYYKFIINYIIITFLEFWISYTLLR